jgi:hypothetical protein
MNIQNREKLKGELMDPGMYFETVIVTILIALTFITIILGFLYMVFTREETETS